MSGDDVWAVIGNYIEGTKTCRRGARVFLCQPNGGNYAQSVEIAVMSRGGRVIVKWERGYRLGNWRPKTIPPQARPLLFARYGRRDPLLVAYHEEAVELAAWLTDSGEHHRLDRRRRHDRVNERIAKNLAAAYHPRSHERSSQSDQ